MGPFIARSASVAKNEAFLALNAPLIPYRISRKSLRSRLCQPCNTHVVNCRYSRDRLIGSRSREKVEQFREARLVRITHGGFAIWLDPFRVLDPQIVVNLL